MKKKCRTCNNLTPGSINYCVVQKREISNLQAKMPIECDDYEVSKRDRLLIHKDDYKNEEQVPGQMNIEEYLNCVAEEE